MKGGLSTAPAALVKRQMSNVILVVCRVSLVILSFILVASCSLAEDITPPPGYEQSLPPPAPTAAAVEIGYPLTAPSVPRGASIYVEKCVRCHGPNGDGQGELAAQLQFPPANFTDPALVANTTPRRWADIITNGNLEKFMPPWGDSLSESQRWNLVAYLYSFSAPAERLETGKAVYEANCAECHGGDGQGDGKLPDFTNQEYMAAKSNQEFFDSVAKPDHNIAAQLSAADVLAAVDYTRALSFDFRAPEITQGTITGQLTNGTTGSAVPAGQPVELHIFDNFEETETLTAELAADGSFEFTGIEPKTGRALIVTTRYGDVLYASEVAEASPDQPDYHLPITVYDSTADPSAITVDRMHIVFEFGSGVAQVGELFLLSNTGDKTLRPEAEDGYTASFALPSGYIDLAFQDGELGDLYVPTADGFADTSPLRPGEGVRQILASFKLAYADSLTFTQTITYPAAVVNILLPEAGVTLTGSNIVDGGVQDLQGSSFHLYTLTNVNAGDTLTFELNGKPQAASGEPTGSEPTAVAPAFDLRSASIGGLSLALAVAIVTYWWVQRKEVVVVKATSSRDLAARREELLAEIAELDEGFDNGEYPESDYRKEREKLKRELKRLMAQGSQTTNVK